MATPRTGKPKGRPLGSVKRWRNDPDRFIIAMATAIFWGSIKIPVQTCIRVATLFHDHTAVAGHEQIIKRPRRLNLEPSMRGKLADGWHLEIWQQREPDPGKPPPKDGTLASDAKRIIRKARRLMTDPEFQIWHEKIALAWHATLWSDYDRRHDPFGTVARALAMRVDMCARAAGEIEYARFVLALLRLVVDDPK